MFAAARRGLAVFARAAEARLASSARAGVRVASRAAHTSARLVAPRALGLAASVGLATAGVVAYQTLSSKETIHAGAVPIHGVPGTRRERTFVAIKPDGVQRQLVGEVISRFERKGYKLVAIKMMHVSRAHAEKHYDDLKTKPFFPALVDYFTSGPLVAMVFEGTNVISGSRKLIGATNPADALHGTVRGDFCTETGRNVIHASDSAESAAHEIALWFTPEEVRDYELSNIKWLSEKA